MSREPRIHIADAGDVARYGAGQPTGEVRTEAAQSEGAPDATSVSPEAAEGDPTEALRREVEQYKDKLLRAKADHQNYVKRAATEREEAIRYGNVELVRALLEVLDDLERTEQAAGESAAGYPPFAKGGTGGVTALRDGLRLIREKFHKVLADRRVEPIEAAGKPFDPTVHEALTRVPSDDVPAGMVAREFQRGYTLDGRVVRPAKVAVSSGPMGDAAGPGGG